MKAALVQSGAEIPYTHDLGFLLDALAQRASTTPESVAQADWLTPWAVAGPIRIGCWFARPQRGPRSGGGRGWLGRDDRGGQAIAT